MLSQAVFKYSRWNSDTSPQEWSTTIWGQGRTPGTPQSVYGVLKHIFCIDVLFILRHSLSATYCKCFFCVMATILSFSMMHLTCPCKEPSQHLCISLKTWSNWHKVYPKSTCFGRGGAQKGMLLSCLNMSGWAAVLGTLHCSILKSNFCKHGTERREVAKMFKDQKLCSEDFSEDSGQRVCQNKPPTCANQHQPWRSILGGPNSPRGSTSHQYDTGLVFTKSFWEVWVYF